MFAFGAARAPADDYRSARTFRVHLPGMDIGTSTVGRHVRYDPADVYAWAREHRHA